MYGINQEQYMKILNDQSNACAICRRDFAIMRNHDMHVDHCHVTGQIRGVLCRWCNAGIGYMQTVENIQKAMSYMTTPRVYPVARGMWSRKGRR
jgi:hypothetical protein